MFSHCHDNCPIPHRSFPLASEEREWHEWWMMQGKDRQKRERERKKEAKSLPFFLPFRHSRKMRIHPTVPAVVIVAETVSGSSPKQQKSSFFWNRWIPLGGQCPLYGGPSPIRHSYTHWWPPPGKRSVLLFHTFLFLFGTAKQLLEGEARKY